MRTLFKIVAYLFSGLRFRLLVLVILTCAPLVALTLHTAWEDRRRAMANWRQRSVTFVQHSGGGSADQEQKLISDARSLLNALSTSKPVVSGNIEGCKQLLPQFSGGRYLNLCVVNADGTLVASANKNIFRLNSVEIDLCHRAIQAGAFMVGDFPGALPQAKTILNLAYPVLD